MEDDETRNQLYNECRSDLLKRMLSNSENFDRAILTLSTAILGLSISFIGKVVPLDTAGFMWLLFTSWGLLVIAIISTLSSFLISQQGIRTQLTFAKKYYLERDEEYLTKTNRWSVMNDRCDYISVVAFIIALVCMVLFAFTNLNSEKQKMSNSKASKTNVPAKVDVNKGATIPPMRAVGKPSRDLGATIPSMQPVQGPQNSGGSGPAATDGGNGGQSGGGQASSGDGSGK